MTSSDRHFAPSSGNVLHDARATAYDFLRACRAGARTSTATFRRLRTEAGEDPDFSRAWEGIGSVEGWLSRREAELLFLLARSVRDEYAIVEIGSYCGRSTAALGFGSGKREHAVYAVDPHTGDCSQVEAGLTVNTFPVFLQNLERLGVSDAVVPVRAMSVDAAATYNGPEIGLLFIDGWHSTEAVVDDLCSWKPYLAPDPIVVFDDYTHPEVAVGIMKVSEFLPPALGSVGKDLVFAPARLSSNSTRLKEIVNLSPPPRWVQKLRPSPCNVGGA